MIKLGTHNSMTYLKPNGSLQELGRTFGKCQNLTIDEQYDFGVRFFDLRIRFHPDGISFFAHGFLEFFGVDPYAVIRALDKKGDCIIQLVMESNSMIADSQNDFFTDFCRTCEQEFTHTVFTGGWSKYPSSGTVVYPFQSALVPRQEAYKVFTQLNTVAGEAKEAIKEIKENKDIRSVNMKEIRNLLKRGLDGSAEIIQGPIAFAKKDNPEYWKQVNEHSYTVMDFIEIGAPQEYLREKGGHR